MTFRAFLLASASLLVASLAGAQAADRPSADEYTRRVQRGIEQLTGGDPSGAIATFREAVSLDGSRPQAPYYIGAAQRATGDLDGALTSFRQAAALAEAASLPRWQGRALHAVASTFERMEGRIEEARAAWQAYVSFAERNAAIADPQLGLARITAIDRMNEQEQAYVAVRQRIAEREEERRREEARGRRR
ncbi:MAG TPA: hypothetical protein VIL20_16910 [Sandaracinaceae bacterium]